MTTENRRFSAAKTVTWIVTVIFILYTVSMVYPFVWAFLMSLKGKLEYFQNSYSLPKQWLFSNYKLAFSELNASGRNMFVMIINSAWYCVGNTVLSLASSIMLAYVVAKFRFFGRDLIYKISIFIMMIPIVGNLPAQLLLYNKLHIYNSPLILIAGTGGFGFEFMVMYSYFRNLSWTYAEAGYIDGARHFTVFFRIMLPQAMSAISALALISFINHWNNYMGPIVFLPDFPTLSAGLYTYQMENERSLNYPVLYAGILMSMLPALVLFVFFQDKLMEMNIAGGLKE